jgi:hypothetical protein
MRLAKFWSRDTAEYEGVSTTARGWSDDSFDAAKARARQIAYKVAERIVNHPFAKEKYPYGDRPLPEPLLRSFSGGRAAVTRNVYGALILNTDDLMFVDIDSEDRRPPNVDVEKVASRHGLSGRFYKTAAGYRVILTDRKFVPGSGESEGLLKEFGADTMYTRLCKSQASFRARLTPKPWRCEFYKPGVKYPFESPREERQFQEWVTKYDRSSVGYATCKLVSSFGGVTLPEFEVVIAYHDLESKAESSKPLA